MKLKLFGEMKLKTAWFRANAAKKRILCDNANNRVI